MEDQHYLELSENPVQFEHASSVNNVFFDEANKQVFAVRSGGATGVVVKGPDDKSSVAFRMEDKGEVKCIKFSIGNKILAVQRTLKSVDFINFIPDYPHTEFTQECKTKNASVLGFCWTSWNEIIFITDQGVEFYQVFPDKRSLKLLKSQNLNVNWYQFCPETSVLLLSTTVQGNVLQPLVFKVSPGSDPVPGTDPVHYGAGKRSAGLVFKRARALVLANQEQRRACWIKGVVWGSSRPVALLSPPPEVRRPARLAGPSSSGVPASSGGVFRGAVSGTARKAIRWGGSDLEAAVSPGADQVSAGVLPIEAFSPNGLPTLSSPSDSEMKRTGCSVAAAGGSPCSRDGPCKKSHVLKLNTTGKFALNISDNLVVVHHQSSQTSLIFDIRLKEPDSAVNQHQPVLPGRSIHPYRVPLAGPAVVPSQPPLPCQLYSSSWSVFQPDIIISASEGYLWYLQVKLPPTVNLLQDKGKLMDFLLRRRDCKMVILAVCSQLLGSGEDGSLPVVATVFDKLNQVYKDYLEAEQSYTQAVEAGTGRGGSAQKRPVRTQAVVDQSDMYTHVLSCFTERKDVSHKFVIAVLMEYIRSLNQYQVTVQHYLYELVIKTLVQHNLFYMLHQFLQYHVLSDSKPLACLLLSLESTYPPAHQLSLDMLKRLSTANDEIVEVLLSKQQVLAALRFIRSVGGHDNVSARKFLDAARQTEDQMLFYTIFRSFQQRNQRLRGSPAFTPGEHCDDHVFHFKQLFGEQALMKNNTV
ncbi:regulator of MON1-CCZ1 complex [Cololabis saira]|uniref:regulator of MON1-CCZ1 complex n=1 Tax=Cololabis saira TaxID=129043 RepID=UPI002AD46D77|nr:regulator of MON1-CCZ1 complex [Cololabis saira]